MTDLMRHSVSDHYPRSDLLSHTSSLPIQPQLQHGPTSSPLCYLFTRETIWDSFIYFEGAWCQCHLHIIQLTYPPIYILSNRVGPAWGRGTSLPCPNSTAAGICPPIPHSKQGNHDLNLNYRKNAITLIFNHDLVMLIWLYTNNFCFFIL